LVYRNDKIIPSVDKRRQDKEIAIFAQTQNLTTSPSEPSFVAVLTVSPVNQSSMNSDRIIHHRILYEAPQSLKSAIAAKTLPTNRIICALLVENGTLLRPKPHFSVKGGRLGFTPFLSTSYLIVDPLPQIGEPEVGHNDYHATGSPYSGTTSKSSS
jgi:hypothetical protein